MARLAVVACLGTATAGVLWGTTGCQAVGAGLELTKTVAPIAGVKFAFQCLPEGTPVDTPDGSLRIEQVRAGDTVIGFSGAPVRVLQVHAYAEDPASDGFHRVAFSDGVEVQLCRRHRIAGTRAADLVPGDRVGGRTVAAVGSIRGVERSYDLLTTDDGYRVRGVPVNSMIEEMYRAGRNGGALTPLPPR